VLERLLESDRVGRLAEGFDVALAAALGHEPAARREQPAQTCEQPLVIGDPVEGGVGERGIDRLGQLELDQVLAQDGRLVAECLARVLDHRRSHVDRVHASLRHPVGHERGHPPRPAAGVENDLVAGSSSRCSCSTAQPSCGSETRS
jgi:hypothetical protein